MDVEILSRVQFAITIGFHYIFPPLSIGIGFLMVLFEGKYIFTKNKDYERLAKFWTKIFALTFVFGVATGVVMEFEFGTNWARYSRFVGDVFGSPLAIEGIFAFAIESSFLGILVFGWNRTKPWLHFTSTIGVFLGSMFSAVWIVVANSWQQTPTGFTLAGEGEMMRAEIIDFWAMVFNPSSVDRVMHVWLGALLAGAFLVMGVHAYYIRKQKQVELSKKAFSTALIVAVVFSLLQLVSGHSSAVVVAEHQPAKLAALEGHYTTGPADLYLVGWADNKNEKTYGIKVPYGLSLLVHQDANKEVAGLDAFAPEDRPSQVNAVFQAYHIMVAIGMLLIALSIYGLYLWRKKSLYSKSWLMLAFIFAAFLPQISNQVGWIAAEMGRQPWIVYGLLRTKDAFSASLSGEQVLFSIILFSTIYTLLLILFVYQFKKQIKKGIE